MVFDPWVQPGDVHIAGKRSNNARNRTSAGFRREIDCAHDEMIAIKLGFA
jgi:hypothetical protein